MTEISEHPFTLSLPGQWEQVPSENPGSFEYREAEGPGSVTVMLLAVRPSYAIADRTRLLNDYASHRSKYESGQTPSLEQFEPTLENRAESIEASWDGFDSATGRRQRHRAVMAGDVLADFCYATAGLDEDSFGERAATILESAAVTVGDSG
jgi:hypothetical protein